MMDWLEAAGWSTAGVVAMELAGLAEKLRRHGLRICYRNDWPVFLLVALTRILVSGAACIAINQSSNLALISAFLIGAAIPLFIARFAQMAAGVTEKRDAEWATYWSGESSCPREASRAVVNTSSKVVD